MPITREDLKQLPELLQGDFELRVEVAQLILDEAVIAQLMQRNPELREALRRIVLTEELLKLPQEFREFREETRTRLTNIEQDVAETKVRVTRVAQDVAETKERVTRVEQDVAETKERVTRVEQTTETTQQTVSGLEQTVIRLEQSVMRLESWQRGEQGRRDGEEYERRIVERAARLFGRGDGGSPRMNERVRKQVEAWLDQAGLLTDEVDPEYDPLIADLIWWKGDKVAVVEISIKVNGRDVERVVRRAQILQDAGLEVLPVVVGSEWAHPETEQLAEQAGVAWRIGNKVSENLVAYRRLDNST